MNDISRFRIGLCISLFAHFLLFQLTLKSDGGHAGRGERLTRTMQAAAVLGDDAVSITVENLPEPTGPGTDERTKERHAYLDTVADAIHARRFVGSETRERFIGVAWITFTILPDGTFSNVYLERSSGDPKLDRSAVDAVRAASAIIRRPASLGEEPMILTLPVKYQYDL